MLSGFALPLTILPFPDYRSALDDVSQGKTDAVILNRFHGMQYSRERGLEDTAIIFNPTRLFFAASRSGREYLLAAIDKHLIQMKRNPDSVYYRSLKRWTSEPAAFRLPGWLRTVGAAAAGLLLVSLAWSVTLRRQVKRSNAALASRNRSLQMLYECGQAMARCADERELLEKLCAILAAGGGCRAAWVSVAENDSGGTVRAVAQSGCGEALLDTLSTDQGDQAAGGPARFDDDACLCLPLVSSGPAIGTLTVALASRGPCPPAELDFLKEFAGNMAFGIEHLRLEETKQHAEAEQRRSERSFRQLIEQAPEAIFIQTQGRAVFLNPAACALLGAASPESLLGRPVSSFIHPDFRDEVMRRIALMKERREPASLSEEVFVRTDGTPVTVEVIATPFVYGNESGSLVFARDVTERKIQSHRYESLVEDMPSVICRYAPDGTLTFVNKAICAFLRLDRAAVVGRNVYSFLQEEDRAVVKTAITGLTPGKPIAEYTLSIRRGDGEMRQLRWVSRAIFAPDGQIQEYQSIGFDMTDQRNLEEQLAQSQKMETIGLLAGGVAHDFNNGLQMILGFAELALMQTSLNDPRADDLREIVSAAQRSKRLTSQLLAFSRRIPMELRELKLNEEIESRRRMLSRLLGEDVRVEISLDPAAPAILADVGHIEQVLLNLAVNARDAMPRGGRLTVSTKRVDVNTVTETRGQAGALPGVYACLSVSDTGSGIPQDIQKNIFDPFFTTKGKEKGTGLGLSTVYGIVRQLKGWIEVESQTGQGAAFKLYFPESAEQTRQAAPKPAGAAHVHPTSARILVVEDMEEVGRIAERILAAQGYRAVIATSIAAAQAALRDSEGFDLIFSDVVLGDGNGLDLAEEVFKEKPGARILFASGYADERVRLTTMHERGWKCLTKPYAAKDLLAAVAEALSSAPASS